MAEMEKQPLSLAQHFAAPDGYRGFFGWVCGYSADMDFMEEALTNFTTCPAFQRAGRISLALILDASNYPLQDVSGLCHLLLQDKKPPFRLLHAKFALLGFEKIDDPSLWKIRLIVSTGNWTRQTVEKNLDLAWSAEISKEDLNKPGRDVEGICADIVHAYDLLVWLGKHFDKRLLEMTPQDRPSLVWPDLEKFGNIIIELARYGHGKGSFFDNREQSLWQGIIARLRENGSHRRNYLAIGSGFFEGAGKAELPRIPDHIIKSLREERQLIRRGAEIDIFVNPESCQAIAAAYEALKANQITIRKAFANPEIFGATAGERFLHAKFIFGAMTETPPPAKTYSNKCKNVWLYLGSGNMTEAGLMNKAQRQKGNLEAGVLLYPPPMHYWPEKSNDPKRQIVSRLLPMRWDEDPVPVNSLASGEGELAERECFYAPPWPCLYWQPEDTGGILFYPEHDYAGIDVYGADGHPCPKSPAGFVWEQTMPAMVKIKWEEDGVQKEAAIPVVDEFGRVGARPLSPLTLEKACECILSFPFPPEIENLDDGEMPEDIEPSRPTDKINAGATNEYPIRQMMRLLEMIAQKQCAMRSESWDSWQLRLEQVLSQISDDEIVRYFRDNLELNPLYPLKADCFLPEFVWSDQAKKKNYMGMLEKIEKKWKVTPLSNLGGDCDGQFLG